MALDNSMVLKLIINELLHGLERACTDTPHRGHGVLGALSVRARAPEKLVVKGAEGRGEPVPPIAHLGK